MSNDSIRILIVDDDSHIRLLWEVGFAAVEGLDVAYAAPSASDAVAWLEAESAAGRTIDAVILDVMMPEVDGIEAMPLLRRSLDDDIVIIIVSSLDRTLVDHTIAERGISASYDAYLAKNTSVITMAKEIRDRVR